MPKKSTLTEEEKKQHQIQSYKKWYYKTMQKKGRKILKSDPLFNILKSLPTDQLTTTKVREALLNKGCTVESL